MVSRPEKGHCVRKRVAKAAAACLSSTSASGTSPTSASSFTTSSSTSSASTSTTASSSFAKGYSVLLLALPRAYQVSLTLIFGQRIFAFPRTFLACGTARGRGNTCNTSLHFKIAAPNKKQFLFLFFNISLSLSPSCPALKWVADADKSP